MGNNSKTVFKWFVLSCEEVSRLSFDPIEQKKLNFFENIKFRLHRSICYVCRRYYKQAGVLKEAMNNYQKKSVDGELSAKKMSEKSKEKLKKLLRDSAK